MFTKDKITAKTRAVHPNSGADRQLRYMVVFGHVENAACLAGQREPSGGLAEADRSLGQPEACSEPARFRHRWRVKELHAQLIVLRGQSVEWVEGDLYGELAPVAAMTPGEHV